jgi:hypothetical protein
LANSPDLLLAITDKAAPCAHNETGTTLLQHLFSLFLSGSLPASCWRILRDNYLMALHKDYMNLPQKLRPLGIGTALIHLLDCHITQVFAGRFVEHFLHFQYAIGIKGGINLLIQIYLTALPWFFNNSSQHWTTSKAIIRINFGNMFNSISSKSIREELSIYFPDLIYLFENLYPAEGNIVWFQKADGSFDHLTQEDGFAQGDPLAPFCSCLPLQQLQRNLQEQLLLRSQATQTSFASSTTQTITFLQVAKLADIPFSFQYINVNRLPLGLQLKKDQCAILLGTENTIHSHPFHYLF